MNNDEVENNEIENNKNEDDETDNKVIEDEVDINEIEEEMQTDGNHRPHKKLRTFNAKEFRHVLTTKLAYEGIKNFVQQCSEESQQDCAGEYLENGGGCTEILRVIETFEIKNPSFVLPVFQAFNITLLKIIASFPEKHMLAEESCRALLNKYNGSIKAMLSPNSNPKQRKLAIKLLSSMVTISAGVAKEVLVHVSFDRAVIELLTAPSNVDDGSSVRTAFTHFLIAFLVEGNPATILNLLERRGLLGSIFHHLIYDNSDLVVVLLNTIQSHILEERCISKTVKMSTFNTQAVQNLVNLYNWKGPSNYLKSKRKDTIIINEEKKANVVSAAHSLLLVLCTSHRNGIVFHDPLIGLGTKKSNPLILTVLESLSNPWKNVYASDLIIKICVSCPDVVKHVLLNVEPFLEPRVSQKWTNVVNFVKNLIQSLVPECVAQFLPSLTIKQIANVIQMFCVPKAVLQVITTETITHSHIGVRHESILLLFAMIESIEKYFKMVNSLSVFTPANILTLRGLVTDYLNKNLPPASAILTDWRLSVAPIEVMEDESIPVPDLNDHLSKLLDILYKYNTLCPLLVDHITKELDTNNFLKTIQERSTDKVATGEMLVKAINLLLICDQTLFKPSDNLFAYTLPLLLKLYYKSSESLQLKIESTLSNLLAITGIFEGCLPEISIWLHCILELETYTNEIGKLLIQSIKNTSKHFLKYITQLSKLKELNSDDHCYNIREIIESLEMDVCSAKCQARATHLSPFIYGIIQVLNENTFSLLGPYLNCVFSHLLHSQTSPNLLTNLLLETQLIDKSLQKYLKSYHDCTELISLKKVYKHSNLVTDFSKILIDDSKDITELLNKGELKHYQSFLVTKLVMFLLTQSALKNTLSSTAQAKYLQTINHIIKTDTEKETTILDSVLQHPVLLQMFIPMAENSNETLCTNFVLQLITELLKSKTKSDLEVYFVPFRTKLVRRLHVMLTKKHKKYFANIMDVVHLLNLTQEQSSEVLALIGDINVDENDSIIIELMVYILNHAQKTKSIPFSDTIMSKISIHLNKLALKNDQSSKIEEFELSLHNYITQYPHSNANFGPNVFETLIMKPNVPKSTAKLAALLLQSNTKFIEIFESNLDKILDKRELIFSLLNATIGSNEITALRSTVYKAHEQIILKFLNKPQKVANYLIENYKIVIKILEDNMSDSDCSNFALKSHKFDVSEIYHVEMLSTIYKRSFVTNTDDNKIKILTNYITTIMNLLINLLKRSDITEDDWIKIETIAKELSIQVMQIKNVNKIEYNDENLFKSATFQTFSKQCLKFGLKNKPELINVLNHLCNLTDLPNTDLGILFEMAVSHSESLNILLSEIELKSSLVSLLLILCKKCPTVMNKSHIPVLLGAYQGTLSRSDQSLLQLLALYDAANVGFHEYRPYLWGKAAVGHYSVRFGVETTLWRQPKPKEVLDILDEAKIVNTITYFPRSRKLKPDQTVYDDGESDVYDPAFYLPLLSSLLVDESPVRWYQCAQRGILGIVIVALTSECSEVRAATCHVLARFHSHIEAAHHGKQRLLWLHLLEATCRGTSTLENLRLSTIAAVFLARCAVVFTQPNHPLYVALGHYIMARECPDFTVIPELLPMLHSADVSYTAHRNFILEVIRDGLCTENDLKVMFRSVAFKFIMDLYNSVLIDHEGQRIILEIISRAVNLPTGARTLVSGYSLVSWLHTLSTRAGSNDQTIILIDILTNLVNAYGPDIKYVQFNILLLLVQFIDNLKTIRLYLGDLVKFVIVLRTVYELFPSILNKEQLVDLLTICAKVFDCSVCNYYLEFGSEFVQTPVLESDDLKDQGGYYLKLLTLKWIKTNSLS